MALLPRKQPAYHANLLLFSRCQTDMQLIRCKMMIHTGEPVAYIHTVKFILLHRGMLPNVFPNHANEEPMYNTIDASLWYFYAVYKYLQYTTGLSYYKETFKDVKGKYPDGVELTEEEVFVRDSLYPVLCEIFESYRDGGAHRSYRKDSPYLHSKTYQGMSAAHALQVRRGPCILCHPRKTAV